MAPATFLGQAQLLSNWKWRLPRFTQKSRALVLTSGFVANEASISALAGLLDDVVIFSDEMNHASIISGICYARCEKVIFRHNDCAHLESLLKAQPLDRPKIIIFESIYSMDGDTSPIAEIADLALKIQRPDIS